MLQPGRLKFGTPRREHSAQGGALPARTAKPWRNPAKAIGPKMTALAGVCASYLQPLDTVERWSILD